MDPAFYLIVDQDQGSQINADPDPDPGQTLKSQKVKACLFVNFGKFLYSFIRILILNTDADPGQSNKSGIRIHKTGFFFI
jgi:hypothetical protein